MKTTLALLLLISLACHSHALKCHTCVASNEDDCNRQGSTSCPQYADACSTITGPKECGREFTVFTASYQINTSDTVMKSCSYKAFCDRANGVSSGANMECCFGDDCNGPHQSHSHGDHHRNSAGALTSSPILFITALLLHVAASHL